MYIAFDQINAALVSIRYLFKKSYGTQSFEQCFFPYILTYRFETI